MIPAAVIMCYNECEERGRGSLSLGELLLSPTEDLVNAEDYRDQISTAFKEIFYFTHCLFTSFLT